MKRVYFFIFLIICRAISFASPYNIDSLTKALDQEIKNAATYDHIKLDRISSLKKSLNETSPTDLNAQYNLNNKLYTEYQRYNYDSAMHFAKQLQRLAIDGKNVSSLADAKLKVVFVMLSGGMFKETFDSLNVISVKGIPDSIKAQYYTLTGLAYYNLSDFNGGGFYNDKATVYLDSAIALWPANSFEAVYFSAIKFLKKNHNDSALANLNRLIVQNNLSEHQLALATSTIGGIFIRNNQENTAIPYLIQASIADIKSSTKETLALLSLAGIIYKNGNIEDAVAFIEKANEDAVQYNARLRKAQIGSILPLIEGKMINTIKVQKQRLVTFLILMALLVLLLAAFAFVIRNQVKKLKLIRAKLYEANVNQRQINAELLEANNLKETYNLQLQRTNEAVVKANELKEQYNKQLYQTNLQLAENNRIKEEYIGYFFSTDTELLARLEKIVHTIDKKLIERKYGEINILLRGIDLKKEKETLLTNFDRIFLKLFPDFVAQFNTLFNEEDKIILKEGQLMNSELRIFALIRLGITDNEKIAEILDYSINTIYAKKTKIRNRTNVNKDDFEKILFEITTLKS